MFFSWEENPIVQAMSTVTSPGAKTRYEAISVELMQQYSQNLRLIPRSTYRKAIGDGIRTITYGAHTSNAASGKSGKHVTLITESMNHNPTLTLCHRLAATMPKPFPYLSITVVVLIVRHLPLSLHCMTTVLSSHTNFVSSRLARRPNGRSGCALSSA